MNRQQLRACLKDVKGLHAEFWSIPTNVPELVELVSGCAIKNRYRYILPNPQSRVKLPVLEPSDPTSGYINGNYVRVRACSTSIEMEKFNYVGYDIQLD